VLGACKSSMLDEDSKRGIRKKTKGERERDFREKLNFKRAHPLPIRGGQQVERPSTVQDVLSIGLKEKKKRKGGDIKGGRITGVTFSPERSCGENVEEVEKNKRIKTSEGVSKCLGEGKKGRDRRKIFPAIRERPEMTHRRGRSYKWKEEYDVSRTF